MGQSISNYYAFEVMHFKQITNPQMKMTRLKLDDLQPLCKMSSQSGAKLPATLHPARYSFPRGCPSRAALLPRAAKQPTAGARSARRRRSFRSLGMGFPLNWDIGTQINFRYQSVAAGARSTRSRRSFRSLGMGFPLNWDIGIQINFRYQSVAELGANYSRSQSAL